MHIHQSVQPSFCPPSSASIVAICPSSLVGVGVGRIRPRRYRRGSRRSWTPTVPRRSPPPRPPRNALSTTMTAPVATTEVASRQPRGRQQQRSKTRRLPRARSGNPLLRLQAHRRAALPTCRPTTTTTTRTLMSQTTGLATTTARKKFRPPSCPVRDRPLLRPRSYSTCARRFTARANPQRPFSLRTTSTLSRRRRAPSALPPGGTLPCS